MDTNTVNTQTKTKFINNNMQGTLPLTLERGTLVKILKQVLCDGFNEQTATSISFDNDSKIAIIKLPSNHGFIPNQVISITGSDSEIVNKEHRVFYTDSDSIRIKIPLLNSTTIGGILKLKVAPLGFSTVFNNINTTGIACFQNKSQPPVILKVIDALPPNGYDINWARYARVVAGVVIDSEGNFINNEKIPKHSTFPDMEISGDGQTGGAAITSVMKWDYGLYRTTSYYGEETATGYYGDYPTSWRIIGDDKTFYLMIKPMGRNYGQYNIMSFGSYNSSATDGDFILTGSQRDIRSDTSQNGKSSVAWRSGFTNSNQSIGNFIYKNIYGAYNPWLNFKLIGLYTDEGTRQWPSRWGCNPINPMTGKIFTTPMYIKDDLGDMRGTLRGVEQFYGIGKLTDGMLLNNGSSIVLTTKMFNWDWDSDEANPYLFSLKDWGETI